MFIFTGILPSHSAATLNPGYPGFFFPRAKPKHSEILAAGVLEAVVPVAGDENPLAFRDDGALIVLIVKCDLALQNHEYVVLTRMIVQGVLTAGRVIVQHDGNEIRTS